MLECSHWKSFRYRAVRNREASSFRIIIAWTLFNWKLPVSLLQITEEIISAFQTYNLNMVFIAILHYSDLHIIFNEDSKWPSICRKYLIHTVASIVWSSDSMTTITATSRNHLLLYRNRASKFFQSQCLCIYVWTVLKFGTFWLYDRIILPKWILAHEALCENCPRT